MSRLTLPNGDWVDLVDRLNYAQARRINMASSTADAAGTIVAAMVTGWALRDTADQSIEFPEHADEGVPLDALSRIPWDAFELIAARAVDILPGQPDPKDTGETSPASAREPSSPSPRTSRKRTSSRTTQDGAGATYNGHQRT